MYHNCHLCSTRKKWGTKDNKGKLCDASIVAVAVVGEEAHHRISDIEQRRY